MSRYATPRKLQTKRGQLRAERNAWCIQCRTPMAKHGKNFSCATCHWSTQIQGTSRGRLPFRVRSALSSRRYHRYATDRLTVYPYCIRCKIRMHKSGPLYRCHNCGNTAMVRYAGKAAQVEKTRQAADLLKQGYSIKWVANRVKISDRTVMALAKQVEPRRCRCGKPFFHKTQCSQRHWSLSERRSDFHNLIIRIRRSLQSGLDEEIRLEIAQMMLTDVAQFIDTMLANANEYLRRYKREYPQRITTDGLEDKLVG